jgi:hypothetical protein
MRIVLAAAAVSVIVLASIIFLVSSPARMNWRRVRTSFNGFTNSPRGELALISIRNEGPVAVVLRDSFRLEYLGVPPYQPVTGLSNLARVIPTHTNLIIGPAAQTQFEIPRPEIGTSWIAWLEFTPGGAWTAANEKLIRRRDTISKSLPVSVGGVPVRGVPVYVVTQQFGEN